MSFILTGPTSITVNQGESASAIYRAVRLTKPYRSVSFSVTSLPPGITAAFIPVSCTPTCQVTLTLIASLSSIPGIYIIQVMARDAKSSKSMSMSIFVVSRSQVISLPPPPVFNNTFFISPTGNDTTGTGSDVAPWLTQNKLITNLNKGDRGIYLAGTYTDQLTSAPASTGTAWTSLNFVRLTTQGGPVTVRPATGTNIWALPDTNFGYVEFYGTFVVDGINMSDVLVYVPNTPHHIRLRDVEVKNGNQQLNDTQNILFGTGTAHELINCNSHDTLGSVQGGYGVYFASADHGLIQGGQYHHCGKFGIHWFHNPAGSPTLVDGVIDGVTANNNGAAGILMGRGNRHVVKNCIAYSNGGDAGIEVGIVGDDQGVYNCVSYNNSNAGIYVALFGASNNTQVKNCILKNNAGPPIQIDVSGTNTILQFNNYHGNGNGNAVQDDSGGPTTNNNNITTDPSFVNAAGNDFHLQNGSGAINAGTTVASVTTDFAGTTRPQGAAYDMGAYERA